MIHVGSNARNGDELECRKQFESISAGQFLQRRPLACMHPFMFSMHPITITIYSLALSQTLVSILYIGKVRKNLVFNNKNKLNMSWDSAQKLLSTVRCHIF